MSSVPSNALPAAAFTDVRVGRLALTTSYIALVLIYLVFGLSKFTPEEAAGLVAIVKPSPFLGWTYGLISTMLFSQLLGVIELSIGALIAARLLSPRLSAIGGLLSAGLFMMTLSFILTTPGIFDSARGIFGFFGGAGQFLIKDLGLLAVSLFVAAESLKAARVR